MSGSILFLCLCSNYLEFDSLSLSIANPASRLLISIVEISVTQSKSKRHEKKCPNPGKVGLQSAPKSRWAPLFPETRRAKRARFPPTNQTLRRNREQPESINSSGMLRELGSARSRQNGSGEISPFSGIFALQYYLQTGFAGWESITIRGK